MSDVQHDNAGAREILERIHRDAGFPGDVDHMDIHDFLDDMNLIHDRVESADIAWGAPWNFHDEAADLFDAFDGYLD